VLVAPVRKRDGAPFPDRIGVGRARNCDIVFRFPSVSKLHAQLVAEGSRWFVIDLDSANGTLVNGVGIVPRRRHEVHLGDHLRFGAIDVELLDAGEVYDRLRVAERRIADQGRGSRKRVDAS
jgi:pSer/pThr/pTyr-binding forkhead associated (FHA) protein